MNRSRGGLHRLLIAVLGVLALTLAAIAALVYVQLSRELRSHGTELVETRVASVQRSLVDQLEQISQSARAVLRVLSTPGQVPSNAEQHLIYLSHTYKNVRRAQIDIDVQSYTAPAAPPAHLLELLAGLGAFPVAPRHLTLQLQDAGGWYIGPAYRDTLELSTHVPLVVYNVTGVNRVSRAIVVVDLTEILFDMLDSLYLQVEEERIPIAFSLYDSSGHLLESSDNFPLLTKQPLAPEYSIPGADEVPIPLLAPRANLGGEVIFASVYDARSSYLAAGSVPQRPVLRRVNRLLVQILMIGALCLLAILVLALALFRVVDRLAIVEQERATIRIKSIQATMNPHFLFNTLDTMVGLVDQRDYSGLMVMFRALSHQLRGVIREKGELVPLSAEIESLESYLHIQRYRYAGRFSFRVEVPARLQSLLVPRFSLQPLVENCFTHAIPSADEPVEIHVLSSQRQDELVIDVHDTGPGCSDERWREITESLVESRSLETHGLGLYSVHTQARASFGPPYGVCRGNLGPGFSVRLVLPAVIGRRRTYAGTEG